MSDGVQPTIVIEAAPDTLLARLSSLWRFRGFYGFLFKELTMRRARGTLLGVWWLIIRPLIPAVALIFVFSSAAPVNTGSDVPYPLFFLSGYIPWRLFQSGMIFLPRTLGWAQGIMRRAYFPRLLVPLAGFGNTLIEFAVLSTAFLVLVVITIWNTGTSPLVLGWHTLLLLPSLLAALLFALSLGMVIGVIALFFRDIIFTTRFVVQACMFLTPVVYPITAVPEAYRWVVYVVNPMAQVVTVSRYALLGQGELQPGYMVLSSVIILLALAASLTFFSRAETLLGDQM